MKRHEAKQKEHRDSIRKEEIEGRMKKAREVELQVGRENEEYQQTGTYGIYLLADIFNRAKYSSEVKELREKYPLETLTPFLEEMYDGTDTFQDIVVKIIECYIYQRYNQPPSEALINQLLRLFVKSNTPSIIKNILLIFNSALLDHYHFSNFLLGKNIVPLILAAFEKYINNAEIARLVFVVIGDIVQRAQWNSDLLEFVPPLLRMAKTTPTIECEKYIESVFYITKLNPTAVGPEVYKAGILDLCLDLIRRFRSRPTSYLYFQFCSIFKEYLLVEDIGKLLRAISDFSALHFKIGEVSGKYSVCSIKTGAYNLVVHYLACEKEEIVAAAEQFMEEAQLKGRMMEELQQVNDTTLLKLLGKINLHFYKKSEGDARMAYKSAFQTCFAQCPSTDISFDLQQEYQSITSYFLLQSGQQQMEIQP